MEEIVLWKEEYRIGDEMVDTQHEELFHKIEELLVMARSADLQANREKCEQTLDYLLDYTVFHFTAEEALQNRNNYVSYKQHKKIHHEFRNTVATYRQRIADDFSAATLKQFLGTMLAWLTIHVRGCDQKILKNEPIGEATTLKEPDQAIAEVMKKLLTGMYNIAIPQIVTRRYSGEIRGTVIIRLVMSVEKERHMLLFGMPERLAKTLYNRISGIFIQNIEKLDEMEESALLELGDIMASYILGSLTTRKITEFAFEGEIYLQNYQEKEYNLDNVVVDVDTKYGTMEVLYCQISL